MNENCLELAKQLFEELHKAGYDTKCVTGENSDHVDIWIFNGKQLVIEGILQGWQIRGELTLGGGQAD